MLNAAQKVVSVLVYADVEAAHEFLVAKFGATPGGVRRDGGGRVVHGEVSLGGETLWLHPVSAGNGLRSVQELKSATGMLNVFVDDVDAHHAERIRAGATILSPPTDQAYGQREYTVSDLDGRIWAFATRA